MSVTFATEKTQSHINKIHLRYLNNLNQLTVYKEHANLRFLGNIPDRILRIYHLSCCFRN